MEHVKGKPLTATMTDSRKMHIKIPKLSLVVLVGPSGSGKSTFADNHFLPSPTTNRKSRCWKRIVARTSAIFAWWAVVAVMQSSKNTDGGRLIGSSACAECTPPKESLAFDIKVEEEFGFSGIWPTPLPIVIEAFNNAKCGEELYRNLPAAKTI